MQISENFQIGVCLESKGQRREAQAEVKIDKDICWNTDDVGLSEDVGVDICAYIEQSAGFMVLAQRAVQTSESARENKMQRREQGNN